MDDEQKKVFLRCTFYLAILGYLELSRDRLVQLYWACAVMATSLEDNLLQVLAELEYYLAHSYLLSREQKICVCSTLGEMYTMTLKLYSKALENLEMALKLEKEEDGNKKEKGLLLRYIGICYSELGQYKKMVAHLEEYLNIVDKENAPKKVANVHLLIGKGFFELDQYERAMQHFADSVQIAGEIKDNETQAESYKGLGMCYINLGRCYFVDKQYDKAIKQFHDATEIAETRNENITHAVAILAMGQCYMKKREFNKALEYLTTHLSMKTANEASALDFFVIGECHQMLDQFAEAIKYYTEGLKIARKEGDKVLEENGVCDLGDCHLGLRQYEKAKEHYEKSLKIAKEINDKQQEINSYWGLGRYHYALRQYREALDYFNKQMEVARAFPITDDGRSPFGLVGQCYKLLGQYKPALHHLKLNIEVSTKLGVKKSISEANGYLGEWYVEMGELKEAKKYHLIQLQLARESGDKKCEAAALNDAAICLMKLEEFSDVAEYFQNSLALAIQTGERETISLVRGNLGNYYFLTGQIDNALSQYKELLLFGQSTGDKVTTSWAHSCIGTCHAKLGNHEKALRYFKHSLDVDKQGGRIQKQQETQYCMGVSFCCMGDMKRAEMSLKESIHLSEQRLENVGEHNRFKISMQDTFQHTYTLLTLILMKTDKKREALMVSERGRARVLKNLMTSKYGMHMAATGEPQTADTTDEILVQQSPLQYLQKLVASSDVFCILVLFLHQGKDDLFSSVISKERELEFVDHREARQQSGNSRPVMALITSVIKAAYEELRVREAVYCEDRSLDCSGRCPSQEETHSRSSAKVDPGFRCDENTGSNLQELYRLVITPVQDFLHEDEVVIIPDGDLYRVPFAALQNPATGEFLSQTHRIRLAPSLTTLSVLSACRPDQHCSSGALIIGNPAVGEVMLREERTYVEGLQAAEKEAIAVSRILGVEAMTGHAATKVDVLERMRRGDAAVIHIAAHGRPETGEIALAPSAGTRNALYGQGQVPDESDYMLTMADVLEAGVRAKLVVLSCCHSGRGEVKMEGVIGITRAFLAAGARSVVATLWAIDDEATLDFMKAFYAHLQTGRSACESLQHAMGVLRESEKWHDPKYWAPFYIIGDDVTITMP